MGESQGYASNVEFAMHPRKAQPARNRGGVLLGNPGAEVQVDPREPGSKCEEESHEAVRGRHRGRETYE